MRITRIAMAAMLLLLVLLCEAWAGEADVLKADVISSGNGEYQFNVTLPDNCAILGFSVKKCTHFPSFCFECNNRHVIICTCTSTYIA